MFGRVQLNITKGIWPAGNSRVQHPKGGRNCFTITTQSLCRVRFSRAMIPTPAGRSITDYTVWPILHRRPWQKSPKKESDKEMITICFCVSLSRGPLRSLPDSAWMRAGNKNEWIKKCLTSFYSTNYLVVPAASMYVVFSSVTHFPAAMTCKKPHKNQKIKCNMQNAAYGIIRTAQ